MTVYAESLKESGKKKKVCNCLLKSNYSKDAEYKVNIQKSIPYLYTINEQEEFEIKDTMPFTCASTKIKHACINLTKYIQVLHEKNYKTKE